MLDLGDLLDLMGGRFDPRSYKGSIRKEHNVPHYFDAVVSDAAEWFEPYAHNFVMIASGNHETAMCRHEFNPTERLVGALNMATDSNVFNGGYSGFVKFKFDAQSEADRARTTELVLHYHHGLSHGKSSAGILAHEKRAAYVPDADIIATAHAHNFWSDRVARLRVGSKGGVYHDMQLHLGVPTYKEETGDGSTGWANEKGFRPKVLGAWWIRFYWEPKTKRVVCEELRAT